MENKNFKYGRIYYNAEIGISKVTILTNLGVFKGYAKVNPEDKDIASSYAGCRYATDRAYITYLKRKKRIIKDKIDKTFSQKRKKLLLEEINKISNETQKIKKDMEDEMRNRPEIVRKMILKKKKNS